MKWNNKQGLKRLVPVTVLVFLLSITVHLHAQDKKITRTTSVSIDGVMVKPTTFTLESLSKYKIISIDSMTVYNHLMQRRSVVKGIKGVLLKDILNDAMEHPDLPKAVNNVYILCEAEDGYQALYSWNELFNGPAGDSTIIILEKNGKKGNDQDGSIAMLTSTDHATGKRFVKGLKKITIGLAQSK